MVEEHEKPSSESYFTRQDPRSLATLPDVLSCLSVFQSEEAELSSSLANLLSAREPIIASLTRLQSSTPQFDELHTRATILSENVSVTAETAERVGGRVSSLDEEMRRVREAGEWLRQVMQLKTSLAALQSAMSGQDWEAAAAHCARVMTIPNEVISGPFSEASVPTSESHHPPAQTLQTAREQLLIIFREKFQEASESRDAAATTRYFKLFPAIGWEREGLQAYASFVVDLVRFKPPASAKKSSPLYYTTALTALFERIAMIVNQHQPVVEKYYGWGKMAEVIDRLLGECDRVTKSLVDSWEEERGIKRKASKLVDISTLNPTTPIYPSNVRKQQQNNENEAMDPREIDKVLSEMASITGRWSLFRKYISEALKHDMSNTENHNQGSKDTLLPGLSQRNSNSIENTRLSVDVTPSHMLFEDLLSDFYTPLEVWYCRATIEKAHRLSSRDVSQTPPTTTTPDDVFYLLKIMLSRLLSTGSLETVKRVLGHVRDIMDREYVTVMKKKLEDVYRTTASSAPSSRNDKIDRDNRLTFIILLNDLDISSSHMDRLTRDLLGSSAISQLYLESDQDVVKNDISSLTSLGSKLRSTLRAGLEQLFNQLIRPKLRTFISDVYKDISYLLNEDAYANAEYQDLVRKRFIKAWESLVDVYQESFTEASYRLFFGLAVDVILRPWEKIVIGLKFTELGAIRFDHDLRSIIGYLSSQTAFGDAREKFVRLQQISTLLNLDSEEDVDEFYNGSGITWKLSEQEAYTIIGLKV